MRHRWWLVPCLLAIATALVTVRCGPRVGDGALLAAKCGRCHSTDRPLSLVREPGAWRFCVERMAAKDPTWITPEQVDAITADLTAVATMPVDLLTEARCGACHQTGAFADLKLSPFQWAYLTDACRGRVPARIGEDEAMRIVAHLTTTPPGATADEDAVLGYAAQSDADMFLVACASCHAARRLRDVRPVEEWERLLPRMVVKNPLVVTPERLDAVRRHIRQRAGAGYGPWPLEAYQTLKPSLADRLRAADPTAAAPPPEGAR